MKIQLNIPDMACGACAKSITNAVQSLDKSATVNADTQTKQVEIESSADENAVRSAIQQAGYTPAV